MRNFKKILVIATAFVMMFCNILQAFAAARYIKPEIANTEAAKTTGIWNQNADGHWSFTPNDEEPVKGGWFYLNSSNTSNEYKWYCFDENGIMRTGWIIDKNDSSIWYYAGETKDATEGSMITGWVTDPQDGKKYYLDPTTGIMVHGWRQIDGKWYYFGERQYADRSWSSNDTGYMTAGSNGTHSYGSMYANEYTPDGYYVGPDGVWNSSPSGSSSSGRHDPVVKTYTVTFNMNGHGTAPGPQKVKSGSKISEPAPQPSAEGYIFGGWFKESACENRWNFTSDTVTDNITLFAKWSENGNITITYKSAAVNKGTVSPTSESLNPVTGTVTGSKASPSNGYRFINWTDAAGNVVGTSGTFIPEKKDGKYVEETYTAHFDALIHKVTAQVQGSHGNAVVKIGDAEVTGARTGERVTFNATPGDGYEFDYWEVVSGGIDIDSSKTDNPVTVTMPATALTLKAHFKAIVPGEYNIILENDGHGTVMAKVGDNEVTFAAPGSSVTLVATPNEGYVFKEWNIIRGIESSDISNNTFTMPSKEVKIKAIFVQKHPIKVPIDAIVVNGANIDSFEKDLNAIVSKGTNLVIFENDIFSKRSTDAVKALIENLEEKDIASHIRIPVWYENNQFIDPLTDPNLQVFRQDIVDKRKAEIDNYLKLGFSGINLDMIRFSENAEKYGVENACNAINETAKQLSEKAHSVSDDIVVSAMIQPEIIGGFNEKQFGQDVTALSKYLDVICPEIFKDQYGKDAEWIRSVTEEFCKQSSCEVVTAVRNYNEETMPLTYDTLMNDAKHAIDGGSKGVLIDQYGKGELPDFNNLSPKEYNIILEDDGHGSASAVVDGQTVSSAKKDTRVILTAVPEDGYELKEWIVVSGEVEINNNAFTMPESNVTVKAVFTESEIPASWVPIQAETASGEIIDFYPAFNGPDDVAGYKFAVKNGDAFIEISSADISMEKLYQSLQPDAGIKTQTLYYIKTDSTAPDLKCYTTKNFNWNDVFKISEESSYPITATGYTDSFIDTYINSGIFTAQLGDKTIKDYGDCWSINGGLSNPPLVKGPLYETLYTTFYNSYGGYGGGLLSSYSNSPWSSTACNVNEAYYFDTDKIVFNTRPRAGYFSGIVLCKSFGGNNLTKHKITLENDGNGTVTASVGGKIVTEAAAGETVKLTATPSDGYVLKSWETTPDTLVIGTDNTFTMPECDVTVKANFEEGQSLLMFNLQPWDEEISEESHDPEIIIEDTPVEEEIIEEDEENLEINEVEDGNTLKVNDPEEDGTTDGKSDEDDPNEKPLENLPVAENINNDANWSEIEEKSQDDPSFDPDSWNAAFSPNTKCESAVKNRHFCLR